MYRKLKLYGVILCVLWGGAFTQIAAKAVQENTPFMDAYTEKTKSLLEEKIYNKRLTFQQAKACAEKIVKKYQGTLIKEVRGDNFYSFYAYSKKLHQTTIVDGQTISLNVVFTYDENEKQTLVKVATPFLNEDF